MSSNGQQDCSGRLRDTMLAERISPVYLKRAYEGAGGHR